MSGWIEKLLDWDKSYFLLQEMLGWMIFHISNYLCRWRSVLFSVLMWTAASRLAELRWMDSPVEPLWMVARAWSCRTVRGGSPSSTSPAVNMTWPAPAPCPAPPPSPRSSATRRTSSWRPSLRSWPVWGLWGVTMFTWPAFLAGG